MDSDSRTLPNTLDRLLDWPELQRVVGLSRPQVWRLRQEGTFPLPLRLSPNRVAWRASEVERWINTRERA
jgi:prophage regulatory protein